jgi:hypothetical protein
MLNVSTAPSARTPIFRFMIPLLAREKFCDPKRKRGGADLVPESLKLKGRPKSNDSIRHWPRHGHCARELGRQFQTKAP